MHQYTDSSSQEIPVSRHHLEQNERHESNEAATRSQTESIRSGFNVSPVLRSSFDRVSAPIQSSFSDAALESSERPASSDQTRTSIEHSPVSLFGRRPRWKRTWITPVTILGFYFISFICAAAHYCFFAYLDGRIILPGSMPSTKTTTVPQAYATTVSLVLVTAFRAALVASIGTCYTQYLWATFRKRALKISLIEDLFQVQANPLRLFNYRLYFTTPMLVAVAMFCWLVPIATVYPPGTLIVGLQPSPIDQSFNVSVFHHRTLQDITDDNVIALISCFRICDSDAGCDHIPLSFSEAVQNSSLPPRCALRSMTPDMEYIMRSNLIVGEISRLKQVSRENSSYELNFLGTILNCETTNRSIESTVLEFEYYPADTYHPKMTWSIEHPGRSCELRMNYETFDFFSGNESITYRVSHYKEKPQYWPCLDKDRWEPTINDSPDLYEQTFDFPGSGIHVIVPVTETVCQPRIVRYYVTISHAGGAQHISYFIGDAGPIPQYTTFLDSFNGSYEQWSQLSDALSIYQDYARSLNQSGTRVAGSTFEYASMSNNTKPYTTENGTIVETCVLEAEDMPYTGTRGVSDAIWTLSVFEQRLHERGIRYDCPAFDPDMANELLINTTISALALNQRFDIVNGTETRTFNIYRFENKLAFFLPYGLSLALAIPILVLGLVALYVQNHGVSAISGGFMQLLMTTTGRGSLEAVVTRGSGTLGGYENVSEELRGMEVRFGELVDVSGDEVKETDTLLSGHNGLVDAQNDDGLQSGVQTASGTERLEDSLSMVRRAGFGTVDEVIPFRKDAGQ